LDEKINKLKKALESKDVEQIKAGVEDLKTTAQKLGEHIYQNTQQAGGPEAGPQQGAPGQETPDQEKSANDDENVVDAEFKKAD
jgi:molecular chaperone DnaK